MDADQRDLELGGEAGEPDRAPRGYDRSLPPGEAGKYPTWMMTATRPAAKLSPRRHVLRKALDEATLHRTWWGGQVGGPGRGQPPCRLVRRPRRRPWRHARERPVAEHRVRRPGRRHRQRATRREGSEDAQAERRPRGSVVPGELPADGRRPGTWSWRCTPCPAAMSTQRRRREVGDHRRQGGGRGQAGDRKHGVAGCIERQASTAGGSCADCRV